MVCCWENLDHGVEYVGSTGDQTEFQHIFSHLPWGILHETFVAAIFFLKKIVCFVLLCCVLVMMVPMDKVGLNNVICWLFLGASERRVHFY